MNKMSLQKSIQNFGIKQALKYMEKDPEENIPKLMDMVDKFAPDGWYEAQRNMIRKVIQREGKLVPADSSHLSAESGSP